MCPRHLGKAALSPPSTFPAGRGTVAVGIAVSGTAPASESDPVAYLLWRALCPHGSLGRLLPHSCIAYLAIDVQYLTAPPLANVGSMQD